MNNENIETGHTEEHVKDVSRSMLHKSHRTHEKIKIGRTDIHFLNLDLMKRCLTSRGNIIASSRTVLTSKDQRRLRKHIIIARELGLIPHIRYY